MIIAFDLGSNFAWAYPGVVGHRVLLGNRVSRAGALLENLPSLLSDAGKAGVMTAVYERPFARGQHATRSLWGIAGIVEACCQLAGLGVLDIDPSSIKKFTTGFGRASKDDMMGIAEILGYRGDNEHEADAFCLLEYAKKNITKE